MAAMRLLQTENREKHIWYIRTLRSLFSRKFAREIRESSTYVLTVDKGADIWTYGHNDLTFEFVWSFVIAGIDKPTIGADFLANFDLLVDVRICRVWDRKTGLQTVTDITTGKVNSLQAIRGTTSYLTHFPPSTPQDISTRWLMHEWSNII